MISSRHLLASSNFFDSMEAKRLTKKQRERTYFKLCLKMIWLLLMLGVSTRVSYGKVYIFTNNSRNNLIYDDKIADFSRTPEPSGIIGKLAIAKPLNACLPIDPAPQILSNVYNFFVLVEESESQEKCSYERQARNAQIAGYVAVIIYRRRERSKAITMEGEGPYVIAVSVTKEAGRALKKANFFTNSVIKITVELQFSVLLYLIPFAVVISVCFLFMCLFSIGRYCRFRMRERRTRLSPANLKKIPTKKYKKGDEYETCAICIEDYEDNDKIRILPCNHAYHAKCVDPWLTSGKKVCPVCKQAVEPKKNKKKKKINRTFVQTSTSSRNTSSADEGGDYFNERTPLLSDNSRSVPSSGSLNV